MKIGYARSSRREESLVQQCEMLLEAGCDRFFCDLRSGVSEVMPGRRLLLESLQEGDSVIAVTVDRLARSTLQGLLFIEALAKKKCGFSTLRTTGAFYDPERPFDHNARFSLSLSFSLAELERDRVQERILFHKNTKKAKDIPFDKLEKIYRDNPVTYKKLFENEHFKPFKASQKRLMYVLEERGAKQASVSRVAEKVAKDFNNRIAAMRG